MINEFHAKPEDLHDLEEFVELHNPGDADLDLSGWSLADAVKFTIPSGTVLPAGGYVVVAMDPVALEARYGVTALGPWSGKLSSSGENIVLLDETGAVRDSVDYQFGFPWPSMVDGEGPSAELLNPGLDRSKGSSWRSSGTEVSSADSATYVEESAEGWRYFKGMSEPDAGWRALAFDDSGWDVGNAAFGYGDPGIATFFSDMYSSYGSAYFRKSFVIGAGEIPASLQLRLNIDDGCVVWINGVEVHRRNVPAGPLAHTDFASDNVEAFWEEITIPNADAFLNAGSNVVAVHGLNSNLHSGDFFFNMELKTVAGGPASDLPTPGARNSVYTPLSQVPPHISEVLHAPEKPMSGEDVTVTARISASAGMGAVVLEYQLVDPGSYIRVTDPEYETSWVEVVMSDDGSAGDVAAGDGVFTAVVAGALQTHRRLTRYRIRFSDVLGNTGLAPFADDAAANFAWFTYDGVPAWQGALRPETEVPGNPTPLQTFSTETLTSVPVYTLITHDDDLLNSQYNSAYNKQRFRGTFIADGVVFDNIEFRNRGQGSTYNTGKNKWRFHFNPSRDFQAFDNYGEPYRRTWGSFSANANIGPWVPVHKGSVGVEEASSLKLYELAGVASPATHFYHFRVIRGVEETPAAGAKVANSIPTSGQIDGQYAGDFWGTFLAVERVKSGFLKSRDLPDSNIYKIEQNVGDVEHLVAGYPGDGSEWNEFRDASRTTQSEAWWRVNMDMDAYYTFHAINRLIGNVDLRQGENHLFYRRVTTDSRWVPVPWDLDMMYIPKTHQGTSINGTFYPGVIDQHRSILENPGLALEYRNRAREILDLVGSDASANGGQIGQLFDQFSRIISPAGTTDTLVNADAAMWNLHPRVRGSWNSSTGLGVTSGQGNHRGNFFRQTFDDSRMGGSWIRTLGPEVPTHADFVQYFVDYATDTFPNENVWNFNNGDQRGYGYEALVAESADVEIPATPILSYIGPAGFPRNKLTFSASEFSGANGYGSTEWRVAEIAAPGVAGFAGQWKYEVTGTWETSNAGTEITVPIQAIAAGKTYRARARFVDHTGRASHWSAPIEFVAGMTSTRIAHYWDFNGTEVAEALLPTAGIGGEIVIVEGGSTEVKIDTGKGFAGLNSRYGSATGTHLRVNDPLGAELVFKMPTTGFEQIGMSVELRRSGSGAGLETWSYTLDGATFLPLGEVEIVDGNPVVVGWDLESISGVDNNPLFAVKVSFSQGLGGTGGNNRFDNLVLSGNPMPGSYAAWVESSFPADSYLNLAISGLAADPDGDGRSNFHEFALNTSPLEGDLAKVDFTWNTEGAVRYPALEFERPAGILGVRYELQSSTTLAADDWETVATEPSEIELLGEVERCIFRDEMGDGFSPTRFLRLKISAAP